MRYLGAAEPVLVDDDMEYLSAVAIVHSVGLLSPAATTHSTMSR